MPLTDTYQKFDRDGLFGVIANSDSPIQFVQNISDSPVVAVACASYLVFWNLKTSEIESFYSRSDCTELVTAFYVADNYVSIGFNDGFVDIYKRDSIEVEAQFRAGRHKINQLLIDEDILFCASGSEINVCDLVSDTGYKLKGHKGYITRMRLIMNSTILVSSGQDSFIKFWSLQNHHCFMTITGHPSQVWDFDISKDFSYLVSGCADPYLRLWSLKFSENTSQFLSPKTSFDPVKTESIEDLEDVDYNSILSVQFLGTIDRDSKKRVYSLSFDPTSNFIVCQTLESYLSIYQLANEQKIKKKLDKKRKKIEEEEDVELVASDYVKYVYRIVLPSKLVSFCALTKIHKKLKITFAFHLANNSLQQIQLYPLSVETMPNRVEEIHVDADVESENIVAKTLFKLLKPGHRTPPFSCHLTEESLGILSVSQSEAKFWSRLNQSCYLTISWEDESLTASAAILAPGGRFAVIGYEDGSIRVYELYSKSLEFHLPQAHSGPVRALALSGDKKSVYSGSSDKTLNCWDFDFKRTSENRMCLGLKSAMERTVPDSVTCLVITPNNQLICVAMVNLHVDVHFR
ncbi:Dip2/Utp12 protein [Cichlidogyrus casuarinus]|uniref:Dip2/Utp12 protein n=1 Tax=Cichlidogyrus casuarinus TaxID=1844966 RepID=A0ABD2PPZ7_9PLAT